MKKYYKVIIILMLGFMMFEPMVQSCKAEASSTRVTLVFDLEWGRKSRDCSGFGICFSLVDWKAEPKSLVRISLENNNLEFEVSQESVKKNPDQFSNDVFIMEEDYEMDKDVSKAFGSDKPLIIPAGKYRIKHSNDDLLIRIPLK